MQVTSMLLLQLPLADQSTGLKLYRCIYEDIMITYQLMRDKGILIVSPEGRLESSDFENIAEEVDPYIREEGVLTGLMIYVESFPGWDDFGALISHLKFVKDHHRKIKKVAAVTDGKFVSAMPRLVDHFVSAKVRHFDYGDKGAALEWLQG
jgi:hypothetical protein